jgi:predicted DNA-binding protein
MIEGDYELATITIRIPVGLRSRLEAIARSQGGRSFSSLVRQILEEKTQKKEVRNEHPTPSTE